MQENRRIQENRKNEEFKETLRKRLEWYTYDASDEEFDEKAVESILYLLDECDPIPQEEMPDADEMWEKFQKIARERDLLPKEETVGADAVEAGNMTAEDRLTLEGALTVEGMSGEGLEEGRRSAGEAAVGKLDECGRNAMGRLSAEKSSLLGKKSRKAAGIGRFVVRHKFVAAALLAIGVLAIGNTVRVVAYPETGFFFWMKKDDAGVQMITSPEGLNNETEKQGKIIYNREELFELGQEWADTIIEVEMPEEYEWQFYEVSELDNRLNIESKYVGMETGKEIDLGMWTYLDKISYVREGFMGYTYVESFEIGETLMDVYNRTQENGNIYYVVCFYEENCQYYVRGQDYLGELKFVVEEYWKNVKNIYK